LSRFLEQRLKAGAKRAKDGRLKARAASRHAAAPRTPANAARKASLRPRDLRTMFVLSHLDVEEDAALGLEEWQRTFRAAAAADDYAIFRDHLRRLGLPDKPMALLDGTIHFVVMWAAFFSTNQAESFADLLRMQTYDPDQATDAVYAFTFDLFGKAYARVLVDKKPGRLDLADLNEAPWHEYRAVGYRSFCISHVDWSLLTVEEQCKLEDEVTDDLRFDYSEDELDILVNNSDETYLAVYVQDHSG
jgi:hypothetical protein